MVRVRLKINFYGSKVKLHYRAEKKFLQILLSSTQAGPDRKVEQEQEELSRNHVLRLFLGSVPNARERERNRI